MNSFSSQTRSSQGSRRIAQQMICLRNFGVGPGPSFSTALKSFLAVFTEKNFSRQIRQNRFSKCNYLKSIFSAK